MGLHQILQDERQIAQVFVEFDNSLIGLTCDQCSYPKHVRRSFGFIRKVPDSVERYGWPRKRPKGRLVATVKEVSCCILNACRATSVH